MILRVIIFSIVFLLCFENVQSQTLKVLDKENSLPIEFVAVSQSKKNIIEFTDESGEVDLGSFSKSEKVEIRLYGYKPKLRSFAELEAKEFTVYLESSTIALEQAVVSATKWSQSRQEIPARITSISKEERELLNPQTAADLLGISGEVFIQKSQQGGGSPMIRGFSTNRLLYTVDGVRMNTAIFRSGNLHNVISLDPFATESTEVFFGPGSIIYGSDAIGAVMSFQTLQAELSKEEDFYIKGSTALRTSTANNEKTGHAHFKYGGKKWAAVTSISRNDYGDLRMGSRGPDIFLRPNLVVRDGNQDVVVENPDPLVQVPTRYDQFNVMQKIRFSSNKKWDFQYGFHYSASSEFDRYDRLLRVRPNGLPASGEWKYGPQSWMMNHLKISHTAEEASLYDQFTLSLAVQNFEESRIDRNFNNPNRRTRIEEVDAYSANLDFMKELPNDAKVFYGLEYIWNEVRSTGKSENILTGDMRNTAARYPMASWNSYAAYATYQKKLSPSSLIQTGLRYSRFGISADFSANQEFYPLPFSQSSNEEGALTASAGWVYTPMDTWTFHLNASTGFRAPNVDDIGKVFDSEPGTVMIPNPNLKAEYAYNLEINAGKVINENIMFDLTAYYTLLENALVRREATLNGQDSIIYDGELSRVLALQNAAFVRIIGLQAALEIKLPQNLSLSSRINIQKGVEEMENGIQSPSRHAPPTFGVTRLEFKKDKYRAQLYTEYAGGFSFDQLPLEERGKPELYAIDENGNPFSPSWATVNAKGFYQLLQNVSLSAGVENISDVRFRTYGSGIAAPGRNFIISLIAGF
ncbi:hypothetical protein A33Q_3431 [Indibacter alkaliphilus LW1]|uniref:TonB-dependent receptor n=1 Tax=Indibacter alkaliphilus (strain CCUG 57479 / KCTC 22604 / LW1) TaxID=1189612 RepID=S2DT28_INDAL|nr:TonB-dependent receptor [Indibacter alkaliphilus]EOZ95226.1 hypothetical protein A33Q_3431 [Indibacter alkaliphilus LW1]